METLSARLRRYAPALLPIVLLVAFSVTFYFHSPDSIIALIGVENAYGLIFILALIGGLSTFSGVPYHLVLISLSAGGLNPWWLGTVTAIGVMLGDSTSYFLGYQGRVLLSERMRKMLERLATAWEKHPRLLPFLFLAYGSIAPFSNDVITIPTGLMRYPFWQVMLPLAVGNLIFNVALALVSAYAYSWLRVLPFF